MTNPPRVGPRLGAILRDRRAWLAATVLAIAGVAAIVALTLRDDGAFEDTPDLAAVQGATAPAATVVVDATFDELAPGDCISALPETYVFGVDRIDCTEPHLLEVFAIFELPDAPTYPGDHELEAAAYDGCIERFEPYVGAPYFDPDTAYDVGHATPTLVTWEAEGDRTVICWTFPRNRLPLEGSARSSD